MQAIVDYFSNLGVNVILSWGWKVLAAILIFIIGRMVARLIIKGIVKVMDAKEIPPIVSEFIETILKAVFLVIIIVATLGFVGVPISPFVAILGAAGLAVGLALQGSLSNFASGVMLVVFRPFKQGDFVEVAGVSGVVDEVTIFNTELNTVDNRKVIIPNSLITAQPMTNYTTFDQRRIDLTVGVSYDDDLKVARDVMTRVVNEHPKVLKDPAPVVMLMELGESSVDFVVRPWSATDDYWVVRSEVLTQLKQQLEAAGCSIPYPQRDTHVHKVDAD
ncbi:MAG: mechanosensitive ion channel domain-containing protein [Pseudomonadota bacterium]